MARLLILSPEGKRGILEIAKPVLTIGRGHANDLVLTGPNISRFHAVVKQRGDGILVMADRGSTNGVYVNGGRTNDEIVFHESDAVHIGYHELRVESAEDVSFVIRKGDIPTGVQHMLVGDM